MKEPKYCYEVLMNKIVVAVYTNFQSAEKCRQFLITNNEDTYAKYNIHINNLRNEFDSEQFGWGPMEDGEHFLADRVHYSAFPYIVFDMPCETLEDAKIYRKALVDKIIKTTKDEYILALYEKEGYDIVPIMENKETN